MGKYFSSGYPIGLLNVMLKETGSELRIAAVPDYGESVMAIAASLDSIQTMLAEELLPLGVLF